MGNEFAEFTKNTRIASDAWNRNKVNADRTKTFGYLHGIWRTMNTACVNAKKRMEEQIKDVNDTYAPNVAAEKIASIRAEYHQLIETNKKSFADKVNAVADEKISEVDTIISRNGNPDLIALIQNLSMRNDVPDREWSAIVNRVNSANDYQAMRLLCEVAPKFNRSYKPPFDAEIIISEIEAVRSRFLYMTSILDKDPHDWTLSEMEFAGDYEHTKLQEQINRLDSAPGVAVPVKSKSLIDRLKEARDIAIKNMDYPTINAISRFLYEKSQYVDDRQVVSDYYKGEAEALITKAFDNASVKHGGAEFDNLVKYFTPT